MNSQVGYDWGPDTAHLLYPLFSYAANSFAGGEYPYWVPGMFGGHPFYNSPQFSPSYPLYFLSWVGKLTWYTAIHYAHVIALLHLWILQLNMYVLLRILKVRILPSLVGACLAAFNPAVYCYLVWPNIVALTVGCRWPWAGCSWCCKASGRGWERRSGRLLRDCWYWHLLRSP